MSHYDIDLTQLYDRGVNVGYIQGALWVVDKMLREYPQDMIDVKFFSSLTSEIQHMLNKRRNETPTNR